MNHLPATEPDCTITIGRQTWTVRHDPLPLRLDGRTWGCLVDPLDRDILVSTAWGPEWCVKLTARAVAKAATYDRDAAASEGTVAP